MALTDETVSADKPADGGGTMDAVVDKVGTPDATPDTTGDNA
jgi:hypothetical protein